MRKETLRESVIVKDEDKVMECIDCKGKYVGFNNADKFRCPRCGSDTKWNGDIRPRTEDYHMYYTPL